MACKPKSTCGPSSNAVKCASKTREGKKCKNNATGRSKYCAAHKK